MHSHLDHSSNDLMTDLVTFENKFKCNPQMKAILATYLNHLIALSFSGVGITMMLVSTFVSIYYNVIIAYSIYYMFASFQFPLPWSDCSSWSEMDCNNTIRGLSSTYLHHCYCNVLFLKAKFYRVYIFSQKCHESNIYHKQTAFLLVGIYFSYWTHWS